MCNIKIISNIVVRNILIIKVMIKKKVYCFKLTFLLINFIRFMLFKNVYTTHVLKKLIIFSNVLT